MGKTLNCWEKQNKWAVRAKNLFCKRKLHLTLSEAKQVEHYLTEQLRDASDVCGGSLDLYLDYFFSNKKEYPLIRACVRGFILREMNRTKLQIDSNVDYYYKWKKDTELITSISKGEKNLKKVKLWKVKK